MRIVRLHKPLVSVIKLTYFILYNLNEKIQNQYKFVRYLNNYFLEKNIFRIWCMNYQSILISLIIMSCSYIFYPKRFSMTPKVHSNSITPLLLFKSLSSLPRPLLILTRIPESTNGRCDL